MSSGGDPRHRTYNAKKEKMCNRSLKNLRGGAAFVVAWAYCLSVTAVSAAPGDISNLGSLGGLSIGFAINDSGQVAGYSENVSLFAHAFRYTGVPGGGGNMSDLGTLGGRYSHGWGINAAGQVVGESTTTGDVTAHAFVFTGTPGSGGNMFDLGTLSDGLGESTARAINDFGQIAGTTSTINGYRAFRYSGAPGNGGAMTNLGTLGGPASYGLAINESGQVAGKSYVTFTRYHAFVYTGLPGSGGAMSDLGTLGGIQSEGDAINDAGQVTGWSDTPNNAASHAFLYTGAPGTGGSMADLGTLGGTYSTGYAINSAGQVVGSSDIALNASHAFIYTGTPGADGIMTDLLVWLHDTNPVEGANWLTLYAAYGLADSGMITGYGYYDDGPGGLSDGPRGFLLDASSLVPEPATISILALGALFITRRRRKVVG